MSKRTFYIRQEIVSYGTQVWKVGAESYEEAQDILFNGDAEHWDEDHYETEAGDIISIECQVCGQSNVEVEKCKCDGTVLNAESQKQLDSFIAEIGQ
jgi:hypothetical protein